MSATRPSNQEPTRFALSSLIDALPDAIVMVDTDGRIVDANIHAVGMFGHTRDQLLGQKIEMLLPEELRSRHEKEREGYVANARVRPMGAGIRLSGLHRDGHEFQVEINLAPYQSPEGLRVVASIRDVAAQRRCQDK